MKKHFVTFLSPGTFVSETTTLEIDSWNEQKAIEMAGRVVERYGATPYCFYFSTRERSKNDLDSKVVATSCKYFLGGKIETLEEIERRNDPNERILRRNMESNGYDKVITNTNSWKITVPFEEGDRYVEYTPPRKTEESSEKA